MSDDEIRKEIEDNVCDVDYYLNEDDDKKIRQTESLPENSINLFDALQLEYYSDDNIVNSAIDYLKRRKLDVAINKPSAFYVSKDDYTHKNRIIIPFKNTKGKIIFYQSRKIFDWDSKPNYLSNYDKDKSIFGIERIKPELETIFIFEGPFDACFMKNGVAVGGITTGRSLLTPLQERQMAEFSLYEKIWVLDSQWRDETSREKTEMLLKDGYKVFVWPKKWGEYKDFNELCVKKNINRISSTFVKKNTLQGDEGYLKFKILMKKLKIH